MLKRSRLVKAEDRTPLATTLTVKVPAALLALEAAGVFEDEAEAAQPLHPIETYGPVGFDFLEPETSFAGPFAIADDMLDAAFAGQADINDLMQVYWQDVPRYQVPLMGDAAWIDNILMDLELEQIDKIDLSFGVEEQPIEVLIPIEEMPELVNDFIL